MPLLSYPRFRSIFVTFLVALALAQVQGQGAISSAQRQKLHELVDQNPVFQQGHTGFCLYELNSPISLYDYNADRLFVPASNIKLVTFYLAQHLLGNRAPAAFYQKYQDHYEVWGTGYPLTLHPQFLSDDLLTPWLRQRELPVTLNFPPTGHGIPRYGSGWSWDDYNGSYVFERSTLPLFGNRLYLQNQTIPGTRSTHIFSSPPNFINQLVLDRNQKQRIIRGEFGNTFRVRPNYLPRTDALQRPVRISPYWMVDELNDALPGLNAELQLRDYPPLAELNTFEVTLPDTVYRRFLQNSDNYLAEQLLLLAAAKRYGKPTDEAILEYATDTLLPSLGIENIRYADGSGLSRYNLFTPRHFVRIVTALNQEVGIERLRDLLPEGGTNGTLKNRFDDAREPYVWAKTGSLSGVVCLSGYVRTKKGRWLAFSFLHNNFVQPSRNYYREMEKVLGWCYEKL